MADVFSEKFKIWEACRATSAATTFFDPLKLEKDSLTWEFIDGALHYNNPVSLVHNEAQEIWGQNRETFLVSIGTGSKFPTSFDQNLLSIVEKLKEIAIDTEKTANDFFRTHERLSTGAKYFRFNVHGMATIGLDEYKHYAAVMGDTQNYLQGAETGTKIDLCVERLLSTESLGIQTPADSPLHPPNIPRSKPGSSVAAEDGEEL